MRVYTAFLILISAIATNSLCEAQSISSDGYADQSTIAAAVTSLRTHADQPFTDQEVSELRAAAAAGADDYRKYVRKWKEMCDGDREPDETITNGSSRADACAGVASNYSAAKDASGTAAYYWKACQLGGSQHQDMYCMRARISPVLTLQVRRGLLLQCHTTSCLYNLEISLTNDQPMDVVAAARYAREGCKQPSQEAKGWVIEAICDDAQRLGSMQDISAGLAEAQERAEQHRQEVAEQNARQEMRNEEFEREMANNAAAANALTHNGNLINETTNRQVNAILSIGGAAARSNMPSPPVSQGHNDGISPTQTVANSYPAPNGWAGTNANPPSNSSNQVTQTTSLENGSTGGSNASDSYIYASPISGNCISQFWDAKYYGWLSFQNNCGEPIYLEFVASNGTGIFGHGGSDDNLAPGASHSTGQSKTEVDAAGGYSIYVCPTGYLPIGPDDHMVQAPNESYRCRKQ